MNELLFIPVTRNDLESVSLWCQIIECSTCFCYSSSRTHQVLFILSTFMIQCHKNILQSGKPCTKVSFIYLPFFRTPAHPALFSALSYPWNSKKQSTLSSHSWETKFNVQLLLLTTLIFSFPKQHVNPKVNSYFVVS